MFIYSSIFNEFIFSAFLDIKTNLGCYIRFVLKILNELYTCEDKRGITISAYENTCWTFLTQNSERVIFLDL